MERRIFLVPAAVFTVCFLALSCRTVPDALPPPGPESGLPVPVLIVSPYQETVYTGNPRPIIAQCEPEIPLVIYYFSSLLDYWTLREGNSEAPVEPGLYYASVNCAPGYGFAPVNDMLVEYRITKAQVRIIAEDSQEASYNGSPRRVEASSEPGVPLSFSYYPTLELRNAAADAFSRPGGEGESVLSTALQSFTRVERAPVEQGVYYVLIYFNGNDRYESASREVKFIIGPSTRWNQNP